VEREAIPQNFLNPRSRSSTGKSFNVAAGKVQERKRNRDELV
jgi:hypothetical protein